MKQCSPKVGCGKILPFLDFSRNKNSKSGVMHVCKACRGEDRRAKHQTSLEKLYGINIVEYNVMLLKQSAKCAICFKSDPGGRRGSNFHVDHCHKTSKIRGLLCSSCNTAIGLLKEDCTILLSAIEYLKGQKAPNPENQ